MKRVILLGGGIDSVTLMADYAKRSDNIRKGLYALHIDYGQKARRGEQKACEYFCKKYHVALESVKMDLTGINQSCIMTGAKDNYTETKGITKAQEGNCFEMRNGILYMVAISYAATIGAREVLAGLHKERMVEGRYVFPDATIKFAKKINSIISSGLTEKCKNIKIRAPYNNLERWQIIQIADKNDKQIIKKAFTCYESFDENVQCGKCVHCLQKKENIKLSGIKEGVDT